LSAAGRRAAWPIAYTLAPKLFQVAKLLALARLLGPGEFGRYSFAMIWVVIAEGLSEFGFRQAIVQQPEESQGPEIGALNALLLLRGLAIAGVMLGVAVGYRRLAPTVVDLVSIACIAFLPLVRSLYLASYSVAMRRLEFRRLFWFETTWRALDLALTLLLVLLVSATSRMSIYASTAGELSALALAGLLLHNELVFSRRISLIRPLVRYGRWIWAQSILTVLVNQFDKLFIAGRFGTLAMGGYHGVNRILQTLMADPFLMLANVWFPKIAMEFRNDPDSARDHVVELIQISSLILCLLILLMAFGKTLLIRVFLGADWLLYAKLVPIFASSMALGALIGLLVTWHRAVGTPQMVTLGAILQSVVYIGGVLSLGQARGIEGVARAVNASLIVIALVLLWTLGRRVRAALLRRTGLLLLLAMALLSWQSGGGAQALLALLGAAALIRLGFEFKRIRPLLGHLLDHGA
jgi:PST family polysaccharide transporter